jgi:hypothetical protein
LTVLEAVDCVVVKIGVPVGDPWVIGERGTRQQKKMAEKKLTEKKRWQKKDGRKHHFSSSTTRQSTINQQSVRYLISQVKWIMQM